jgi:hypothetical protein
MSTSSSLLVAQQQQEKRTITTCFFPPLILPKSSTFVETCNIPSLLLLLTTYICNPNKRWSFWSLNNNNNKNRNVANCHVLIPKIFHRFIESHVIYSFIYFFFFLSSKTKTQTNVPRRVRYLVMFVQINFHSLLFFSLSSSSPVRARLACSFNSSCSQSKTTNVPRGVVCSFNLHLLLFLLTLFLFSVRARCVVCSFIYVLLLQQRSIHFPTQQ